MFRLLSLCSVLVIVAEGSNHYGDAAPNNGYESSINKNNAARQLKVNRRAQAVGTGTGTAHSDGVPGTPLGRTGYDRYSYGNGYCIHGNTGYGGQGNGGYGLHGPSGYNGGYDNGRYGDYGRNNGYGHDNGFGHNNAFGQKSAYGHSDGYGHNNGYGQNNGYPGFSFQFNH